MVAAADIVVVRSEQTEALEMDMGADSEKELEPSPESAKSVDPVFTAGSDTQLKKEEFLMEEGVLEIDLGRRSSNTVQLLVWEVNGDKFGRDMSNLPSILCDLRPLLGRNLLAESVNVQKEQEKGVKLQALHTVSGYTFDPGVLLYSLRHEMSQGKLVAEHKEEQSMQGAEGDCRVAAIGDSEDDYIVSMPVIDVLQITATVVNLNVKEFTNSFGTAFITDEHVTKTVENLSIKQPRVRGYHWEPEERRGK
jgi:hypothetical protein